MTRMATRTPPRKSRSRSKSLGLAHACHDQPAQGSPLGWFCSLSSELSDGRKSNDRAIRHGLAVGDHDNPITDHITIALRVVGIAAVDDLHISADAAILVQDGSNDH